jgi:hypothetical protein
MRKVILALLTMVLMACHGHKLLPEASDKPFIQILLVHADKDFDNWERQVIKDSAAQWENASHGRIQILIQFDTDFTSEDEVDRLDGNAVLMKGDSRMGMVRRIEEDRDGQLLGVTIPRGHGSIIVLISDRLQDPMDLMGVATHEFGHALGMPDLDGTGHVMSGHHAHGVHLVDGVDVDTCRKYSACP